mmetsp:Transcript_29303/g.62080  ORF Transcript_29303/g.62080 Transcript_29303/m.62080 type:complete len:224 (+) Transcript_29303:811-1482(+)
MVLPLSLPASLSATHEISSGLTPGQDGGSVRQLTLPLASGISPCIFFSMASHSGSYWKVFGQLFASSASGKSSTWRKSRFGKHLSRARNLVQAGSAPAPAPFQAAMAAARSKALAVSVSSARLEAWCTMAANFTWKCALNQCRGLSLLQRIAAAGLPNESSAISRSKKGFFRMSLCRSQCPQLATPRGQSCDRKMSSCLPFTCNSFRTSNSRTWYTLRSDPRS